MNVVKSSTGVTIGSWTMVTAAPHVLSIDRTLHEQQALFKKFKSHSCSSINFMIEPYRLNEPHFYDILNSNQHQLFNIWLSTLSISQALYNSAPWPSRSLNRHANHFWLNSRVLENNFIRISAQNDCLTSTIVQSLNVNNLFETVFEGYRTVILFRHTYMHNKHNYIQRI